jgi:subtilase family serine protease
MKTRMGCQRFVTMALGALAAVSLLAACSSHKSNAARQSLSTLDKKINPSLYPATGEKAPIPTPQPDPPDLASKIGLPSGSADQITFYFTLPTDDYTLVTASEVLSTPGTGSYRHFLTSYTDAARTYGAKPGDIEAAVHSVEAKGLSVMVDPSRTFVRVWATADQWAKVLGRPLNGQVGSPDAPFDFFDLPVVPEFDKLTYVGAGATVYDAALDTGKREAGASISNEASINLARASAGQRDSAAGNAAASPSTTEPWPPNAGAFPANTCVSGTSAADTMYAPSQIATAYHTRALEDNKTTMAARVSVIDLGGGFKQSDVQGAAQCFGYLAPSVEVHTGDGMSSQIHNNSDETELDLQTMGAFVPGGTIQLIEATNGPASLLDAMSRMLGDPAGLPDAASISYAQCAVAESMGNLALIHAVGRLGILGLTVGVPTFVAAGDWGSTTCGNSVPGTSQAFAASAPWATAVGGTRLSLDPKNQRASEVVWDDYPYGLTAGGGGGISKVFARPWYQNAVTSSKMRVVPDFSFLAAVSPGWPVMLNGKMGGIGGTSASSPFAASQLAILSAQERLAGRPRVGFANPWIYLLYQQHPELFYDVVSGTNDLDRVGCCTATNGFDTATGLGVPNLAGISQHLPPPSP